MLPTLTPEAAALLTESAEWRLLGLLFEYPSDTWRQQLTVLIANLQSAGLVPLAEAALEGSSPGMHLALFGPAGSVPLREVTYQGGVQLGYLMSEVSGFYEAFGYANSGEESGDHLAVELGFIAFLRMKEAYAVVAGDSAQAEFARETSETFRKNHLAVMVEPISIALANFAPEYLAGAGQILLNRVGPAPRSSYPLGAVLAGDDESEDMTCGASGANDELIHIQP